MPSDGIAAITQRLNGAAASFEARVEKKKKKKKKLWTKDAEVTSSCFCCRPLKGVHVCVYVVCDIHRRTVRAGEALNQRPTEE